MQKLVLDIPSIKDPRWTIIVFLGAYAITLVNEPYFGKSLLQCVTAFSVTVVTDIIFSYSLNKKWHFPLSSMVTSFGIVLIVFSPYIWPFVVIPFLAIASKHLIRFKNLHIFNPNNLGISAAFILLGAYVSPTAGRWASSEPLFFAVCLLGLFISWRVNRHILSISYIFSFISFSILRSQFTSLSIEQSLIPLSSGIFFLFTFYHITDPLTSPQNLKGQLIFGVSIGLIDNIFRFYEVLYSPFFSLLLMTAIQPFLPILFNRDVHRQQWVIN